MPKSPVPAARELTPQEAQQWLHSDPQVQLVDVRSNEEFKEARIANAKLVPLKTQDIDKKRPVLLYCAAGGRSARALEFLESHGYAAKHVLGGISGWAGAGLPYER
jgi:rhodanese-related sulfurtransferase